MASDQPTLRVLYDEGERDAFFRKLIPKLPESEIEDFRTGLGADMAQMELIEELVTTSFEKSGLSEYKTLEDPEALSRLNKAILEPVEWLSENLKEVPSWFTTVWCEHIIERLWKKRLVELAEKRAKIKEGKKPRSERSIASATGKIPDEAVPLRTSSRKGFPSLGLEDMILQLTILDSKRDTDNNRVYQVLLKRCFISGTRANEFSSYSHRVFIGELERAVNRDPANPFIHLQSGTVGYLKSDNFFKSIVRPQGFESALKFLYNSRGVSNILKFDYRNESSSERNARINTTLSQSASSTSPGTSSHLEIPIFNTNPARVTWRSSRQRSPPPPAPTGPLPPVPAGSSPQQLAELDSQIVTREKKNALASDAAAATQARAVIISVIRRNSTSATPDPVRLRVGGNSTRMSKAGSTISDTNKPLPPVPAGGPRYSGRALAVLHDPAHATPRGKLEAKKAQKPDTSLPRPSAGEAFKRPTKPTSNSPEPAARKSFLTKGGGVRKPTGHSPAASTSQIPKPPRLHAPGPVTEQAKRAWAIGNKSNPTRSRLPVKNTSSATQTSPKLVDFRPGGVAKAGAPRPLKDGSKPEEERAITPFPGPFLRYNTAQKHTKLILQKPNPLLHRGSNSLTDPEDDRVRPSVNPKPPKKPTIMGVGWSMTKKRVSTLLAPKSPRGPDSQGTDGDVLEIINQNPEPGHPLTPPGPDTPKSTSSAFKRRSIASKDKEVVVGQAKNPLGLVKVPRPRLTSTADRFEHQNKRYPRLYTEVERRTFKRGGDEYIEAQYNAFAENEKQLAGEEIEEAESDDEEDPKRSGDYMIEQFQKMQNMPELTQMYDHAGTSTPMGSGPWEACCEVFQINPLTTKLDEKVIIAGIKTPIYQYQAFGVYWQMKNSRAIGGGFVADEMGLGKTLSFLAYIVVERQLAFLWDQVKTSRGKSDPKERTHLQPGEAGPSVVCPNQETLSPGWIACPCASYVTSMLVPKPGVRLAIVPPSLVPTWVEQWDTHVDVTSTLLQMSLVIAHDGSNPPAHDGKMSIRDGRHPAVTRRVQANRTSYSRRSRTIDEHFYPDSAQPGQERVLVITTRDHYNKTWGNKFEYRTEILPEDQNLPKYLYKGKSPGIVYGIAMIDECHEDWQKNKGRSALVAGLPKAGRPFVWGYSGTPLTTTPRSIEGVLWAVESLWPKRDRANKTMTGLEQEQESDLWKFCWKKLDILCREFESEVKKGTQNQIIFQDFYLRFKPFLTALILRRTTDTPWFGQPLIKLMPHIHRDVILAHNLEYDPKIDQFRWLVDSDIEHKLSDLQREWRDSKPTSTSKLPAKFSFNTEMRLRYKQRLFATFPYLAVLVAEFHADHLELSVEELKKFRGVDEKRNPYFKHLRLITEKSPKVMWLYNFITALDMTCDVDGEEQKIVILSEFNQVAFILKLWIEKHIKNKSNRVGIVYAGQRPRDRKSTIEAFTDAKDQKKERKQKANYQFLVGTTRIIGAGLQLTRSCNVVLMEPDYEFHRELQGYARVHRIGQRNPTSYSYRLIDGLDEIEGSIVERQRARGEHPGRLERVEDSDTEEAEKTVSEKDQQNNPYPNVGDIYAQYGDKEEPELDQESRAILGQFPEPRGYSINVTAPLSKEEQEGPQEDLYSAK